MLAPSPAPRRQTWPQTPAHTPAACARPCAPAARRALAPLGAASSASALPTRERRTPRWLTRSFHLWFTVQRATLFAQWLGLPGFVYAAMSSLCFLPSGIALGPASAVSKILLLDSSCKYSIPILQTRRSPRACSCMLFQFRLGHWLGCCSSISPRQKADSFLTGVQDGEAGKRQTPISYWNMEPAVQPASSQDNYLPSPAAVHPGSGKHQDKSQGCWAARGLLHMYWNGCFIPFPPSLFLLSEYGFPSFILVSVEWHSFKYV